jgi:hypothetical protein
MKDNIKQEIACWDEEQYCQEGLEDIENHM